ncbi:EAL domain-containing protein [Shewanella sp. 10N.261.52.F9]|uniref:EAL domain-containing protein n=1 Tax=Shewanella sp. 10N.261.52.F9 TaxID=3229684 RepID=UPI00354DDD89
MQSVLSRLSLRSKLLLSAALPVFILVLLAIVSAATLLKQYQDASANVLTTQVTLGIEKVIFELQKERGLSAGYHSSSGTLYKQELQQQWLATDKAFQQLLVNSSLEETINTVKSDINLFNALQELISKASAERRNLDAARQDIIKLNTPEFFDFYSLQTLNLINFVSQLRFKSDKSYQVLVQSDLVNMLKVQELAGQERGLINQLLSAPILEPEYFERVTQISLQLDNAAENAFTMMTLDNRDNFSQLLNSPQIQQISDYRAQLKQQIHLVKQAELISDLVGYGGLNYNLNGYLTTLNPDYLASFKKNYFTLQAALESLSHNQTLNPNQQLLVNTLRQTAENYQEFVLHAEETGQPKADVTLKFLGLDMALHSSLYRLQRQVPVVNSQVWWQSASVAIDKLHQLNLQLTEKIARQNEIEKQQIIYYLYISLFTGMLFFYLVFLLGRSIANNLIDSVTCIVDDVEKLAKDPDLELNLALNGNDELTQISKAINQMMSERMKSKRALHQASAVFSHSAEGIMVTDANNCIELVNPAFTKITGYNLEDVKGKKPSILSSGHHTPEFYQQLWQSLSDNSSWEGEIWNQRKDGQIYPEYLKITAVKNSHNETIQHIGLFLDISNNKQYEQDIWYKSNYDSLTKLPNRHLFSSRLQHAIDAAVQQNTQVAIFFIDLDRFKYVNELHGHTAGNKILKQSATRLEAVLGIQDSIARIGGDEFIVIAPLNNTSVGAEPLAQKLSDALSRPFILDGKEINISSSFGIAFYPEDGQDIEMLLHNSETAMYQAKRDGRAHYQYFSPEMNVEMLARMQLEQRLRKAVKQSEFHLEYQPIVDMRSGAVTSVEALIRWQDPEYGLISPEHFIPIAEETGLIEPLGEWILHQALTDLNQLHSQGLMINMAINVSGRQCINSKGISFYDVLNDALMQHAIAAQYVHIEITESILIEDKPMCLKVLEAIKELGIEIYLDDFGTGYSALSYLTKCPISVIKIDKSFIDKILIDPSDEKLIRAIVMMAQNLDLPLVAEGIETIEQWRFLNALGCDYAQGYLMSKPLPSIKLLAHLQQAKPFDYLTLPTGLAVVQ